MGIDALPCEVEVDVLSKGLSPPTIVGLPDPAVRESIDRIRSALFNCGYSFPKTRSVINLAPADIRKEGPAFDLPIALGLMLASRQLASDTIDEYLIAGELALDGRCARSRGASRWRCWPGSRSGGGSSCRQPTPARPRWSRDSR